MSGLGCPKCGRTPVVYHISTKKWVCKNCQHEWEEKKSDGSAWEDQWGPQYMVNQDAVKEFMSKLAKPAPQKALAKKPVKIAPKKPAAKKPAAKKAPKKAAKKVAVKKIVKKKRK
jgi:ribosomal protein L37AE/L43A